MSLNKQIQLENINTNFIELSAYVLGYNLYNYTNDSKL